MLFNDCFFALRHRPGTFFFDRIVANRHVVRNRFNAVVAGEIDEFFLGSHGRDIGARMNSRVAAVWEEFPRFDIVGKVGCQYVAHHVVF